MFAGDRGFINQALGAAGLVDPPRWLSHPDLALFAALVSFTWIILPLSTLILLGGLLSIDPEISEAARVDGANRWQEFLRISLPMIAPQAALSLIWLSFNAFNTFALILPMTGGGPGRGTELLGVLMYLLGFRDLNYSSAAAVMVILLLINGLLSYFYLRVTGATASNEQDEAVLRANLG